MFFGIMTFAWTLAVDGETVESGEIDDLVIPPMTDETVTLPYQAAKYTEGELILTVSFRLKTAKPWAEKGYETSFSQIIIREQPAAAVKLANGTVRYRQSGRYVSIKGDNFSAEIKDGALASLKYDGREYILKPMKPDFFRALTDRFLWRF